MSLNNISILIVDDDPLVRRSLCEVLSFEGYVCLHTGDGIEALERMKEMAFDIVISDMKMPNMEGLELLRRVKADHPQTAVIMITGFGSIENAVAAMREGALDYVSKPIIDDEIKIVIKRIADERRMADENKYLKTRLLSSTRRNCHSIIGGSYKMLKIYDLIDLIASTKTTVLVTGESGTGKRLVAHAIHDSSPDSDKRPFVEVSCGALSETLLESELFGHVKGAFTGAIKDRVGRFEGAEGGTIFLDEIDAFSPALQVKLLRVLQDGEYERVGETATRKANVRIIAATNQDLQKLIQTGRFRNDLFYRLNIISVDMPPLRERKDDLELLVKHFIEKHARQQNKKVLNISDEAMASLADYHWPGNVRELENIIERACVLVRGETIGLKEIPEHILKGRAAADTATQKDTVNGDGVCLKSALKDPEKKLILEALDKACWNKKQAARLLGINRTTLYKKLKQYGISPNNKTQ